MIQIDSGNIFRFEELEILKSRNQTKTKLYKEEQWDCNSQIFSDRQGLWKCIYTLILKITTQKNPQDTI